MQDVIGVGQTGNFHWWEGVVEDNLDPLGAGRCKVRILGHNSPAKEDTSTAELPWAYPVMPLNSTHGKIVALKPGTRVFGFFRDGLDRQQPVMLGTINIGFENAGKMDNYLEDTPSPTFDVGGNDVPIVIGKPAPRMGDYGFFDDREGSGGVIDGQPRKSKVIPDADKRGVLNQEDVTDYYPLKPNEINTPRLARGIIEGTSPAAHAHGGAQSLVTKVKRLSDNITADTVVEPKTKFGAQYPFNTVEESDSGHLREVDDTPGAERLKETHRTGTFYEIHPDGTKVTKVVGDNFSVTIGDDALKVEGSCAVHIVGEADIYCEKDIRVRTEKTADITVVESADISVGTHLTAAVGRNMSATCGGEATITSVQDALIRGFGNVDVIAEKDVALVAKGVMTFKDSVVGDDISLDTLKKDIDEGRRVD